MPHVDAQRIAELLQPFVVLDSRELSATSTYLDLLLRWNVKMNLTAVREPKEIIGRHFGESFFAASRLLSSNEALRVIDLGSGAGFPGLPMAIFAPGAHVTLIEAQRKKAAFLNEVASALKLRNVKVVCQRGESYSASADLITMRAVEAFTRSLPVAVNLAKVTGRVGLMIGASQASEAKAATPEVVWEEAVSIPMSESRVLLVGTKMITRESDSGPAPESSAQ